MQTGLRNQSTEAPAASGVTSYALPVIAAGVVIAVLYWARAVIITSLVAVIIAFLLEPFVGLLTRIRIPRPLATFLVCIFAVMALYFAGASLWRQLSGMAREAPELQNNLTAAVESTSARFQSLGDTAGRILVPGPKPATAPVPEAPVAKKGKKTTSTAPSPPQPGAIQEVRIHEDRNPVTDYVVASLGTVYQFVLMSSFVPFLVYFMLSWRDHIYKSFLRFFEGADRLIVARSVSGISTMARAFVVGNFMIGIILAALSCSMFAVIGIRYPFLIGSLSGFMSLVPYIGLPLGMMPPPPPQLALPCLTPP